MKICGTKINRLVLTSLVLSTVLCVWMSELFLTQLYTYSIKRHREETGVLIVGAGLSGAVLAHLHATVLNQKVLVVEKRGHVGGNCYDYVNEHGIRVSKYGAHLFHTKDQLVWRFMSQFSKWLPYEHRVVGKVDGTYVPVPVNIDTVNALFNETIRNQTQMSEWLKVHQVHKDNPQNGEEAAKSRVGEILYDKLFKHYTYKQWEKFPNELDASVLQRIPVKDNFDDRYFPYDAYQALPGDGYTAMIARMLNHSLITVKLNSDFFHLRKSKIISTGSFSKVFFTGPIDYYFSASGLDKLEYRSIRFKTVHLNLPMFQPNVVVNYPQGPESFTRIVEYKHLYNQVANGTTIVKEFSSGTGDPYYPVPNERNRQLYSKYAELAETEEKKNNVYFVGRLASYKYFNMDQAVLNAIKEFSRIYSTTSFLDHKIVLVNLTEAEHIFNKNENMSSIAIITSHCKENLSWVSTGIAQLCKTHQVNIFIYEKCHALLQGSDLRKTYPECNILQTELPNVGREGHTWLYHMLMKQSSFSDINIFVQGEKEVKIAQMMGVIRRMRSLKKSKSYDSKYSQANAFVKHYTYFNAKTCCRLNFDFLGWTKAKVSNKTCDYYYGITGTRQGCLAFICTFRGEFMVTDVLLRRKLATYRKLMMTWFDDLSSANNPTEGHLIERFWTLFFRFPLNPRC